LAIVSLLLVPSPLVGPASWAGVADRLTEHGEDVRVVHTGAPQRPQQVVDAIVEAASGLTDLVLVPHSNAGLYAPLLSERLAITATVYVDAALAGPGPHTDLAPPDLLAMLRGLADHDGVLPPWTRWWDDPGDLFPDEDSRARLERGQPRLPLSYFEESLPVPPGWTRRPSAYLAFGDTYAEEVAFARERGWPVTVVQGRHLHAMHEPEGVAAEILRLARLAVGGHV
jgi:hypothetical protein